MKPQKLITIGALTIVIFTALLAFSLRRTRPAVQPLQARFLRFTNGIAGTFASTLPAYYAGFMREWYASGTNVAVFGITNWERRALILQPYVGVFENTNVERSRYETFVLNAPTAYGILLRPGQGALVEVPVLPRRGPGQARFGCSADYYHLLPRAIEELRGFASRRPADFRSEWFYSAPIDL